jgi:hypothetical protein
MKKYTKKELHKRSVSFYKRTGKFRPLDAKIYVFIKQMYWYLTKQELGAEFEYNLYRNYIELVDTTYKFNRETPDPNAIDMLYLRSKIILENEYSSPWTFILLNNSWHYYKMHDILDILYSISKNFIYYGHLDRKEFYDILVVLRTSFSQHRVDIQTAVGKYPRKIKSRFNRTELKKTR